MSEISLLDLDITNRRRAFPNLALMKLSAYHKAKGDSVNLNYPLQRADITYASCVFTWNWKERRQTIPDDAIIGGSGTGKYNWLSSDVEHMKPDYSLYPNVDFSMGFTSRGCPRRCPFCLVPDKEGGIQAWTSPYEFYEPRFKKILLLDNNLLAASNWKETFRDLIAIGAEVDFNQGLDIRLLTDEHISYLKRLRVKVFRFAFDNLNYEASVRSGIDLMTKSGIPSRDLSFYVLVGFSPDDKAIERVRILQSYGVEIYPMIYKDKDGKEPNWNYGYHENLMFHGTRNNLRKFLRIAGRLA